MNAGIPSPMIDHELRNSSIIIKKHLFDLEMKMVVEEIVRFLNLEKLVPSYKFCVTVSCLRAMRNLQRNGHLPNDPTLFKNYCSENQFVDVRLAAIESLIDFTRDDANSYILSFLLDIIETGGSRFVHGFEKQIQWIPDIRNPLMKIVPAYIQCVSWPRLSIQFLSEPAYKKLGYKNHH